MIAQQINRTIGCCLNCFFDPLTDLSVFLKVCNCAIAVVIKIRVAFGHARRVCELPVDNQSVPGVAS